VEELAGRALGPDGKYRLLHVIGRGGMGVVFEAEQVNLRRRVAIKVANPAVTSQPGFTERFLQEAQAIALLEHAHILPVYDVGEDEGRLFLVTRLMTGGTLKQFIQERGGQPCTPQEALHVARQVLSALDYAHGEGIIHRDLKPSNILLHGGQAFLADFGVAKLVQQDLGLTRPGMLMGTPDYMAPEQVLSKPLDGQADLYAFGVVLYEMLTGRVPFRGETPMAVALQHVQAPLPPPRQENPQLSAEVSAVLTRALAKEPTARFPTGDAFAAALAQAVEESERKSRGRGQWSRMFAGWRRADAGSPGTPAAPTTPPLTPVNQAPSAPSAPAVIPAPPATPSVPAPPATPAPAVIPAPPAVPPPPVAPATPAGRPGLEVVEPPAAAAGPGSEPGVQPAGPEGASWWTRTLTRPEGEAPPDELPAGPAGAPAPPVTPAPSGTQGTSGSAGPPALAPAAAALAAGATGATMPARPVPVAFPPPATAAPATAAAPAARPPGRRSRRQELLIGAGVLAVVALLAVLPWVRSTGLLRGVAGPGTNAANPASPTAISPAPPLLAPRSSHTSTLLKDGKVLVVGGREGARYLATAEVYDPASNRWLSAGGSVATRTGHTATALPNGTVLVVGGQSTDTSYTASAERYDPATNSWSPAATMSTPRTGHTATALPNGTVLVVGGYNGERFLPTAERYDPATNSWSPAATMSMPRIGHTATALPNGQVLVVGGLGAEVESTAERYDPATNSWSPAGTLTDGRISHTATLLPGGQVLVAGGNISSRRGTYLASAERYDPSTNSWSPAATMAGVRGGHSATLLPGGQVLVAGGLDGNIAVASAETYDPGANRWTPAAAMANGRWLHVAALLPGGQVLVAGGQIGSNALAAAETYDPAANRWLSGAR
jgi:serine/threonine protein kinase/N-acetylneuraminic acid mutarotase